MQSQAAPAYAGTRRLRAWLIRWSAEAAKAVLDIVVEAIPWKCRRFMQFAHAKHRPKVKLCFGKHFKRAVQADLLFRWGRAFILLVDECTRYKFACINIIFK